MNDPQSQKWNAPPPCQDQRMSLAGLAAVASMAEPMDAQTTQPSPCSAVGHHHHHHNHHHHHQQQHHHHHEAMQMQYMQESSPTQSPCVPHAAASPCRHVQFNEARVVGTIMPCSHMSQAEKEEIWYSNSSLDKFKNQVRSMCRKLRECPQTEAAALATTPEAPPDVMTAEAEVDGASDEASSSRGLEHRVCRKRLRNKQLALRCVLKAQMRSSCPDFIANISSKCTFWAKEIARNEGSRDFEAAYSPRAEQDLNASVASMDISTGDGGSSTTDSTAALNASGSMVPPKEKKKCAIMARFVPSKRSCSFDSDCSRPRKNCRFTGNSCNGSLKSVFMPKKDCDP
ncbi:unnamed protein product [Cylindrotheca closterium]|uniref:Uncharacterized protein n=1 Tax=Cylindrotheca closterium TaxID=2856 RepID=A0AAD2FRY7_9STRA|nr:unnamed protein product [Cylindrotheca closterium]